MTGSSLASMFGKFPAATPANVSSSFLPTASQINLGATVGGRKRKSMHKRKSMRKGGKKSKKTMRKGGKKSRKHRKH